MIRNISDGQYSKPVRVVSFNTAESASSQNNAGTEANGVPVDELDDAGKLITRQLPGAKGSGAVGAAGLIRKYGSLEALLAEGKLQAQADALRLYRRIATMDQHAPIPLVRDQKPTWKKAAELVRSWQLRALAERLEKMDR